MRQRRWYRHNTGKSGVMAQETERGMVEERAEAGAGCWSEGGEMTLEVGSTWDAASGSDPGRPDAWGMQRNLRRIPPADRT